MLVSLAIAALGAIAIAVSTRAVIVLQDLEAKDNAEAFEKYKIEAGKETEGLKNENLQLGLKLADAELSLEQLRKHVSPRTLNRSFGIHLKGKPVSVGNILYLSEAPDGYSLAHSLEIELLQAGWQSGFAPVPSISQRNFGEHLVLPTTPPGAKRSGVIVVTKEAVDVDNDNTAEAVLIRALRDDLGGIQLEVDPSVEGRIDILIGFKP